MRRFILVVCVIASSLSCFANPTIPAKLETYVAQTYPNAEHKTWCQTETGYKVYFNNGKIKWTVDYDLDCQLVRAIRYYDAENLPPLILDRLHQKWSTRSVFGVTEVSTPEGIQYSIVLQDDAHWYTVESDADGILMQTEKMTKGGR